VAAVLVVVDDEDGSTDEQFEVPDGPTSSRLISAPMMVAIAAADAGPDSRNAASLVSVAELSPSLLTGDSIICPLTFRLPEFLKFPGRSVYLACQDIATLRHQVSQRWPHQVGKGQLWLPIVLTARGPLYGEVIGLAPSPSASLPAYQQPVHLADRWRQPLYQLGFWLLALLNAPPAVYLLQFGLQDEHLCFDRLFPFPATPAIATIGLQTPDLFQCHWRCLTHQAILDLTILPPR